jgi:hypothetical protein
VKTRGWHVVRIEFAAAIVFPVILAFLLLTPPNYMIEQPPFFDQLSVQIAILMYLVGLAWMIRIYRTDPEAHRSFWRSRRY